MSVLTKRDLMFFFWMIFAPFISFLILTTDFSLNEMLDGGIMVRLGYGTIASLIWLMVWAFGFMTDRILRKSEGGEIDE